METNDQGTETDSRITNMNLDPNSTSYLHTDNFKCHYCGIRWISRAAEFSPDDIQTYRGLKLCFCCVSEQFAKIQTNFAPSNAWNRRQWVLKYVLPDEFNCHGCKTFEERHGVRNCWNGLARIYSYSSFEPHNYCVVCFEHLFQIKCPSLHPKQCKRCENGPLNPKPLRYSYGP